MASNDKKADVIKLQNLQRIVSAEECEVAKPPQNGLKSAESVEWPKSSTKWPIWIWHLTFLEWISKDIKWFLVQSI